MNLVYDRLNQYVDPSSANYERISILIDSIAITLPKYCTPIDKECLAIGVCAEERTMSYYNVYLQFQMLSPSLDDFCEKTRFTIHLVLKPRRL